MKATTATRTIGKLHTIFACWGLPEQILTDNGPSLHLKNFRSLCFLMVSSTQKQHHTTLSPMGLQKDLYKLLNKP